MSETIDSVSSNFTMLISSFKFELSTGSYCCSGMASTERGASGTSSRRISSSSSKSSFNVELMCWLIPGADDFTPPFLDCLGYFLKYPLFAFGRPLCFTAVGSLSDNHEWGDI